MSLLTLTACRTVSPGIALSSTMPLDTESQRLTYIGDASGKACQSSLFYFIPLSSDSNIYEAKRAALLDASARYRQHAVALVDVSIDHEAVSYIVYERRCTWVRGRALASH